MTFLLLDTSVPKERECWGKKKPGYCSSVCQQPFKDQGHTHTHTQTCVPLVHCFFILANGDKINLEHDYQKNTCVTSAKEAHSVSCAGISCICLVLFANLTTLLTYATLLRPENISSYPASPRQPLHVSAIQPLHEHQWREPGDDSAVSRPSWTPAKCWQREYTHCAGEEYPNQM